MYPIPLAYAHLPRPGEWFCKEQTNMHWQSIGIITLCSYPFSMCVGEEQTPPPWLLTANKAFDVFMLFFVCPDRWVTDVLHTMLRERQMLYGIGSDRYAALRVTDLLYRECRMYWIGNYRCTVYCIGSDICSVLYRDRQMCCIQSARCTVLYWERQMCCIQSDICTV